MRLDRIVKCTRKDAATPRLLLARRSSGPEHTEKRTKLTNCLKAPKTILYRTIGKPDSDPLMVNENPIIWLDRTGNRQRSSSLANHIRLSIFSCGTSFFVNALWILKFKRFSQTKIVYPSLSLRLNGNALPTSPAASPATLNRQFRQFPTRKKLLKRKPFWENASQKRNYGIIWWHSVPAR